MEKVRTAVTMASTSKAFRRCVHPCPRYLTPDDTHDLCVFCLGEEHARDVLEGAICMHCELFSMRKLRSRLSLFSRKEGQPSASHGSGLTVAEARRGMILWGSQAELADELEMGLSLSHSSATNEGERLDDDDAISLTSSDPAAGALLGYAQEEQEMSEGDEAEAEPDQSSCLAYDELLEVMEHATARLDLLWKRAKMVAPRGRLDERYLSGHNRPARVSLPFLPDLHAEVEKEWKSHFPHAFTGFSILVMLTWRGCVKTAMRGCPLWKRRWPAICLSPWARHPLLRVPPCHLSPFRKHLA